MFEATSPGMPLSPLSFPLLCYYFIHKPSLPLYHPFSLLSFYKNEKSRKEGKEGGGGGDININHVGLSWTTSSGLTGTSSFSSILSTLHPNEKRSKKKEKEKRKEERVKGDE